MEGFIITSNWPELIYQGDCDSASTWGSVYSLKFMKLHVRKQQYKFTWRLQNILGKSQSFKKTVSMVGIWYYKECNILLLIPIGLPHLKKWVIKNLWWKIALRLFRKHWKFSESMKKFYIWTYCNSRVNIDFGGKTIDNRLHLHSFKTSWKSKIHLTFLGENILFFFENTIYFYQFISSLCKSDLLAFTSWFL